MLNNWLKTSILLASLAALMVMVGATLGGRNGALLALAIAGITNFIAYWFADSIVLTLYGAKEIKFEDYTGLYNQVILLAKAAELPVPKLYIINNRIPNAFATGRNPKNSAIAVTTGALTLLNENELSAVISHELSHIKHYDTLIATIAATVAGAVSMLANWVQWAIFLGYTGDDHKKYRAANFLMIILSPLIAAIIQMAIARSREFAADSEGAKICKEPEWLINALIKLENIATKQTFYVAEKNPTTAHLFIVNPLQANGIINLFSTHPPTNERIKRLRMLAIKKA